MDLDFRLPCMALQWQAHQGGVRGTTVAAVVLPLSPRLRGRLNLEEDARTRGLQALRALVVTRGWALGRGVSLCLRAGGVETVAPRKPGFERCEEAELERENRSTCFSNEAKYFRLCGRGA